MSSAEELKLKGNDYMKEMKYQEAQKCYEEAFKLDPKNNIIASNLSEVHLKQNHFKEALESVNIAIELNPEHPKSLYRKLRALIGMKKYSEAYLLSTNPLLNEIQNIMFIKRNVKEMNENSRGNFTFSSMIESEKMSMFINCGEYENFKIKYVQDGQKGIKAIAAHEIKRGEILIASKAISFTSLKENMEVKTEDLSKIYKNSPKDNEDILTLFDGTNANVSLTDRVNNKNMTESRIENIKKLNSIEACRNFPKSEKIANGIWIHPSYFNHSCLPNTYHFGIGDCFFIIAQNDIKENTEIFINYLGFENTFEQRKKLLKDKWLFDCHCDLCNFESNKMKTVPEKVKFEEYLTIMTDKLRNSVDPGNKLDSFVEFLDNNKKKFSCYEMALAYVLYSKIKNDVVFLEKGLRYAEGRFFLAEFNILNELAKLCKNDENKFKEIKTKMEKCLNRMFPQNKELTDYILNNL